MLDNLESTAGTTPLDNESASGTSSLTVIHWIVEIKNVWARDAASTLDLARVVSASKTHLRREYGHWSRLWQSGQVMPISKSTADRLAIIGEVMGELDSATSQNLPRGWNILYCLAGLRRETLEQLIEQKEVHAQLTLRRAKELVARLNGKRTQARMRKATVQKWLWRSAKFVATNLPDWSTDMRELATEGLIQLIEQISVQRGTAHEENGNSPILDSRQIAN